MKRLIFLFAVLALTIAGCKKRSTEETVVRNLYKLYKNGEISRCYYNGKLVYDCMMNHVDASGEIYDENGNHIATCNFAWGRPTDSVCYQLKNCKTLYRTANSITGQPAVDEYGVGK